MPTKLSSCCISGHIHSGSPKGKDDTLASLNTYVTGNDASDKAVLMLTDIFGFKLNNARIVADEYASSLGACVYLPDVFDGDFIDVEHLQALVPLKSAPTVSEEEMQERQGKAFGQVGPWLERQSDGVTQPRINAALDAIAARHRSVAIVGFCWGGRQAVHLAKQDSKASVIVANHPSYTECPDAFEAVAKPILIQVGDKDGLFPSEQVSQVKDSIFAGKKDASVIIYPGAAHGFTIRGDLNNDEERKQKEDASNAAIQFIGKFL